MASVSRRRTGGVALAVLVAAAIAGVSAGLGGFLVSGSLIAAFAIVGSWRWPRVAVLVAVFLASVLPIGLVWEVSAVLPLLTATRVVIGVVICGTLIGILTGTVQVRQWVLWPAIALWLAAVVASVPNSIDIPTSRLRVFAELAELAAISALVYIHFDRGNWRQVLRVLVAAAACNASIALVELWGWHPLTGLQERALSIERGNPLVSVGDTRFGIRRIQGTFSHPAFLASNLAMMLPVAYSMILTERRRRALFVAAVLVMVLALVATTTRAAWLTSVLAVSIVTVYAWGQRRRVGPVLWGIGAVLSIVIVTAPSALVAAAQFGGDLLTAEGGVSTRTTGYRLVLHEEVFQAWTERPWLGHGAGTFDRMGLHGVLGGLNIDLTSPDSHLLRLLAEVGAIGLISFVLLVTMGMVSVSRAARQSGSDSKLVLCGVLAGLGGYIAINLTVSAFAIFQTSVVFWALVAAGSAAGVAPPEELRMPNLDDAAKRLAS